MAFGCVWVVGGADKGKLGGMESMESPRAVDLKENAANRATLGSCASSCVAHLVRSERAYI